MLNKRHFGPIALVAILVPVLYFFFYSRGRQESVVVEMEQYYSWLDGTPVENKSLERGQVVGIMIDSHPDARPESGLSQAKIVYEAPVEGGITRYMAIFDSAQTVSKVGPIRSARPYYLDWLQEYGSGLYMHVGGSPDALTIIKKLRIFDVNQFYWGDYFWRSTDRLAPHNVYTKSDFWQRAVEHYQAGAGAFMAPDGWRFAKTVDQESTVSPLNKEITIRYNPYYSVTWKYDAEQTNYVRYVNGKKYIDLDGAEVRARNVLIQYASMKTVDEEGRKEIATVGKGEAKIIKKGRLGIGFWEKKSVTDRTRFYDPNGNEVVLLPGTTWVEVVPKDAEIEVTN